jgi:ZIP family zinc transporter
MEVYYYIGLLAEALAASQEAKMHVVHRLPGAQGYFAKTFTAGAMLTTLADDMMPEAFEHEGKLVGFFTGLGFLLAAILRVAG